MSTDGGLEHNANRVNADEAPLGKWLKLINGGIDETEKSWHVGLRAMPDFGREAR